MTRLLVLLGSIVLICQSLWARELAVARSQLVELGSGFLADEIRFNSDCVRGEIESRREFLTTFYFDKPVLDSEVLYPDGTHNIKNINNGSDYRSYAKQPYLQSSRSLNYFVRVEGGSQQYSGDPEFQTDGKSCGEAYVKKVVWGGTLRIWVDFTFETREDARYVERFSLLKDVGLRSLKGYLKDLQTNYNDGIQVSIGARQVGGNSRNLLEIFGNQDQAVNCIYPNIEPCFQLVQDLVDYAVQPNQFAQQFFNPNFNRADPEGATVLSYELEKYPSAIDLNSLVQHIARRERAAQQWLRYDTLAPIIEERIDLSQSEKERGLLQGHLRRINADQASLGSQIENCNLAGECKIDLDSFIDLNPEDVSLTEGFLEFCKARYRRSEIHNFFDVVDRIYPAANCLDQKRLLESQLDLNLSGEGISNVEPLAGLQQVITLDLSRNEINDLTPLSSMGELRQLTINENKLSSLSGLRRSPQLRLIQADDNPLVAIEREDLPASLVGIRAIGNQIANIENARDNLEPQVKSWLIPDDICTFYRQKVLDMGLIDRASFELYSSIEWAPVFRDEREIKVDAWVACVAAYRDFVIEFPGL
ncbi:hypothetical protein [Pseudobacteriovorax antillogorgiicola]|nr:hypothetical protein [Pseudobacteriovorax antillogorgiicola]